MIAIKSLSRRWFTQIHRDSRRVEPQSEVDNSIALILARSYALNPGFEAQKFMPEVLPKLKQLRDMIVKKKLNVDLEIDGGISLQTAADAVRAGANVLVAGSAIYHSKDYRAVIDGLKKAG